MRILVHHRLLSALALCLCGVAGPVFAQVPGAPASSIPASSDPAERLTANLTVLARNPRDLNALIGAGESAIAVGDGNAALSFLARAEEISPLNGRIKSALGSALVLLERPGEALKLFSEASTLGIPEADLARDRGLAYDLRGDSRRAQRDYLMAQRLRQDDEITRRLALSYGISGDKANALALLEPLIRKQDQAAWRARAFILAMNGDLQGAEAVVRQVMPTGMGDTMTPFLRRLGSLNAADRALAVNFGTMPSDGQRYASVETGDPFRPAGGTGGVLTPASGPPGQLTPTPAAPRVAEPPSREPRRRPGQAEIKVASRDPVPAPPGSGRPVVQEARPGFTAPATSQPLGERVGKRIAPVDREALPPEIRDLVKPANAGDGNQTKSASVAVPAPKPVLKPVIMAGTLPPPTGVRDPVSVSVSPPVPLQVPTPAPVANTPPPALASPVQTAAETVPVPVSAAPIFEIPTPEAGSKSFETAPQIATVVKPEPARPAVQSSAQTIPPAPAPVPGQAPKTDGAANPARVVAVTESPKPEPLASSAIPALASAPVAATPKTDSFGPPALANVQIAAVKPAPLPEEAPTAATGASVSPPEGLAGIMASLDPEEESAAGPLPTAAEIRAVRLAVQRKAAAEAKSKSLADAEAKAELEKKEAEKARAAKSPARIWVQVATGSNEAGLPGTWKRLREKSPATFKGLSASSAPFRSTNRVLVGPFKNAAEAKKLLGAMQKAGLSGSTYTSEAGQEVAKLSGR